MMTTKGDMVDFDTQRQRLGIGSANQVLQVTAGGLPAWQTLSAGGATVSTQSITPTSLQTTTSSPYVDVTNGSLTLANRSGGSAFISAMISSAVSSVPANVGFGINYDSSLQTTQVLYLDHAGGEESMSVSAMDSLDGGVVKLQWRVSTGTATLVDTSLMSSRLFLYEVS